MSLVKIANKLPKLNGKFFGAYKAPVPIYRITILPSQNGSITSDKVSGEQGTLVTLSNTPNTHYSFGGYGITGATLTGNKFLIGQDDVSVQGSFIEDAKYSLSLTQVAGGSINANKNTGYAGDIITLSNTPSSHYTFNGYSITGATLTGNQFAFGSQNVTAKGTFVADPIRTVTLTQVAGGNIAANPTTGYDGTTVTLSNTANAGYTFNNYTLTGGTLTGNKFVLNGSNATASLNLTHNVYNLTLQTDGHGKLTAGKTTGYYNDTTTLTPTPSANYLFSGFSVTGGTITNSSFKFGLSNATAKAWFKEPDPYNPYNLEQGIARVKFKQGYDPSTAEWANGTHVVDQQQNIWDVRINLTDSWWGFKFTDNNSNDKVTDIIAAELSGNSLTRVFENCTALTSVGPIDIRNSKFPGLFANCSSLQTINNAIDLSSNFGDANEMFDGCSSLTSVGIKNSHTIKDAEFMFAGCGNLKYIGDVSTDNGYFNMSAAYTLEYMFNKCHKMPMIMIKNNLSNASSIASMFNECSSIKTAIPNFNVPNVERCSYAFADCHYVSGGITRMYNNLLSNGKASASRYFCFKRCGISSTNGSAELSQIPNGWK